MHNKGVSREVQMQLQNGSHMKWWKEKSSQIVMFFDYIMIMDFKKVGPVGYGILH